jgi:hypothetical protein
MVIVAAAAAPAARRERIFLFADMNVAPCRMCLMSVVRPRGRDGTSVLHRLTPLGSALLEGRAQ